MPCHHHQLDPADQPARLPIPIPIPIELPRSHRHRASHRTATHHSAAQAPFPTGDPTRPSLSQAPAPCGMPQAASLVAQHDGCDQSMSSAADHALTATRRPLTRLFPAAPALLSLCSAMTRPACPTTHHIYLNLTPPPPRPTSQSSTDSPAIISLHTRCLSVPRFHTPKTVAHTPPCSLAELPLALDAAPPLAWGPWGCYYEADGIFDLAGGWVCGLRLASWRWRSVVGSGTYLVRLLLVLALVLGLMRVLHRLSLLVSAARSLSRWLPVVAVGCWWMGDQTTEVQPPCAK